MKQKLLLGMAGLAMVGAMVMPAIGFADTTASTTQSAALTSMLQQIQALQAQIQALKSAQAQVASTSVSISSTLLQMRNLRQGMSGDDVKALQAILAADPSIYSGNITGYFGSLTGEALKKYQKKFGLEAVGFVGPKTLKKLSEHMNELGLSSENGSATSTENRKNGENEGKKLCVKVPPGHLIAPGWLKKGDNDKRGEKNEAKGVGNQSASILPPCKDLPKGIEDKIGNNWNHGSTTESYTYPMINLVTPTSTATTSEKVVWTTNKPTTSAFYYGITNPVTASTSTQIIDTVASTTHSVSLTGLATSTTYYFVITVSDSKNTAKSSQYSFTTPAN